MWNDTENVVVAIRRLSRFERAALWQSWAERSVDPDYSPTIRDLFRTLADLVRSVHDEAKAAAEAVFAEAVEAVLRADFADVEFLDAEGREIDPFT